MKALPNVNDTLLAISSPKVTMPKANETAPDQQAFKEVMQSRDRTEKSKPAKENEPAAASKASNDAPSREKAAVTKEDKSKEPVAEKAEGKGDNQTEKSEAAPKEASESTKPEAEKSATGELAKEQGANTDADQNPEQYADQDTQAGPIPAAVSGNALPLAEDEPALAINLSIHSGEAPIGTGDVEGDVIDAETDAVSPLLKGALPTTETATQRLNESPVVESVTAEEGSAILSPLNPAPKVAASSPEIDAADAAKTTAAEAPALSPLATKNPQSNSQNANLQNGAADVSGESQGEAVVGELEMDDFLGKSELLGNTKTSKAEVSVDLSRAPEVLPRTGNLESQIRAALKRESKDSNLTAVKATGADPKWLQSLQSVQQSFSVAKPAGVAATITAPFTSPEWQQAVGEKVLQMASQRVQSAEIHMDPAELGPLQVRVSVQQDNASVNFVSHHASVRDALDQGAFRLRELFQNEGLNLTNVDVSDRSSHQHHDQNRDPQQSHGQQGGSLLPELEASPVSAMKVVGFVDYYV